MEIKNKLIIENFLNNSLGKFDKGIAKKLGLNHAIVFSNFCSKALRNNNVFPYLIDDIAKDAFIHRQTVTKILSELSKAKYIKRHRRGIPSKIWYSIDEQTLLNFTKES